MEDFVDAYRVLGVDPGASQQALKAAHRKLVRRHHPDLHPPERRAAATRAVQDVNVAFGLVRDPEHRAAYDRIRRAHLARQAAVAPLRAAGGQVAAADAAAAAQWDDALTAAGRWAGRWWQRHQGRARRTALRTRRAGLDVVGRVLWLVTTIVGGAVGLTVVAAVQRLTDVEGVLAPLAGALSGLGVGSYRGWCRRLRLAGLDDRGAEVRGTVARLAAAAALVAACLALDLRLDWGALL